MLTGSQHRDQQIPLQLEQRKCQSLLVGGCLNGSSPSVCHSSSICKQHRNPNELGPPPPEKLIKQQLTRPESTKATGGSLLRFSVLRASCALAAQPSRGVKQQITANARSQPPAPEPVSSPSLYLAGALPSLEKGEAQTAHPKPNRWQSLSSPSSAHALTSTLQLP